MTFTKTSQKFGQWSDPRANTVYGLGFNTEADLAKVCFLQEVAFLNYFSTTAAIKQCYKFVALVVINDFSIDV